MYFIWWFFFLPHDHILCKLWVSNPPTQTQLVQACGTWPLVNIDTLVWRAINTDGAVERFGSANDDCDFRYHCLGSLHHSNRRP